MAERVGYCHVRKEDLRAGSAVDRDPPFAAFDVVHRSEYEWLQRRHDALLTDRNEWKDTAEVAVIAANELTAERDAARQQVHELEIAEQDLRREWWGNHGHAYQALYGDDGEMQCGACPADFKRDSLGKLRKAVFEARLARAAAVAVPDTEASE